jgi:hypothetical protein
MIDSTTQPAPDVTVVSFNTTTNIGCNEDAAFLKHRVYFQYPEEVRNAAYHIRNAMRLLADSAIGQVLQEVESVQTGTARTVEESMAFFSSPGDKVIELNYKAGGQAAFAGEKASFDEVVKFFNSAAVASDVTNRKFQIGQYQVDVRAILMQFLSSLRQEADNMDIYVETAKTIHRFCVTIHAAMRDKGYLFETKLRISSDNLVRKEAAAG